LDYGLEKESPEQGRTGGWPKGWFEKEGIFSHMQFKYLLQLLKAGLYDRFFKDIKTCLPPYLDPAVYGRSPLENVSFITCSAHPRPNFRGRGFQPRLTGVNAEFVHIMLIMSFGEKPFAVKDGALNFRLNPVLPSWMFTKKEETKAVEPWDGPMREITFPAGSFSAMLFGRTLVTYLNPARNDTFGDCAVRPQGYVLVDQEGGKEHFGASGVVGPAAEKVRQGHYLRIIVELG